MRRQACGGIIALAFIANFASYSEAFHVVSFTPNRSSRPYERGCAVIQVDGYISRRHVSGSDCVRCSSRAEGRKGALAGQARRGFRVFGLQREGEDVQGSGVGDYTEAGAGLDDKTLEELWTRPRKHLLSVGRAGVKPSHVRSLNELVEAHILVKVKVNIPNADYAEVGRQLCGGLSVDSAETQSGEGEDSHPDSSKALSPTSRAAVSVVTSRAKQNMILFAKTEFLSANANGGPSSFAETIAED